MANDDKLSDVLIEFARTLITDFPIQGILDRLVERMVGVLDVTAAGVTLILPGMAPQYVAASNKDALEFEQLQTTLGEGPCITAYETGESVSVPDLANDDRYPRFAPRAVAAGMAAVFTFPLNHGDTHKLGALDLYRGTVGDLDVEDMAAAQTLADVAAAYLLNAQGRKDARDVSDRFRESAMHDALTGLPNRLLLQHRLNHAAQRARRSHGTAAVLFADLDRFKQVNDTHGHPTGDALLVAVADRLSHMIRPGDTLARVSGDEFVILCEDLARSGDVEALAQRIQHALAQPFDIHGQEISISASVGVAYAGPGESVSSQLVQDADTAMYQAKRRGGAVSQVLDLRAAKQAGERDDLERDLRSAVSGGQLALVYQPIVQTADGLVTGVEALLRWKHPTHGAIPALTTVSIAEQSGLIIGIGAWVLERACSDRTQWLADHPDRPLDVSVNLSVRQLLSPGLVGQVERVLDKTGMDAGALVLEVTEGIFIEDDQRAMTALADLRKMGLRLALDDFGTGFCSLGYLQRLPPVDIIKIDRTFVSDIDHDRPRAAIASAVTGLAHDLGLRVIAEGVETEQQRHTVLEMGCEHAQGYLYARPMPVVDLTDRLLGGAAGPMRLPDAGIPEPASYAIGSH